MAQGHNWGQKPILEEFRPSQFRQKNPAEFKGNFLSNIISTNCVFCNPSRVYKPTPIQHDGSVASLRPETHSRLAFKWISVWVFQIDYSITFTVFLQKVRQFFIQNYFANISKNWPSFRLHSAENRVGYLAISGVNSTTLSVVKV